MRIELHMIQNFAPACLNRDDTNAPKDCEFGGVRRARISSQCIKRAIRTESGFCDMLADSVGDRTKLLLSKLRKAVEAHDKTSDDVDGALREFISATLSSLDGDKTKVLLYLGRDEIERLAAIAVDDWNSLVVASQKRSEAESKSGKEKKSVVEEADKLAKASKKKVDAVFKTGTKAADIALFGRMVAENTDINVDAACQVAHAISTHKVAMEMDFYTAVDDLQPKEETGAGMMGLVGYNSACFYRYTVVHWGQLIENLGGDTDLTMTAVEAFIRASVRAIPTGKQNTFANHNPPDFNLAVVRANGAPYSLSNAFVRPVRASEQASLVQASVDAFRSYWTKLHDVYGADGIRLAAYCGPTEPTTAPADWVNAKTFDTMVKSVMDIVSGEGS